ncbi:MAG: hypothetical protein NZ927_01940 [Candidatus Calescibacterium sp.]|nr:hypothetical protein [Candidatus Calescibacterium sp.]MCX7734411.1 hypothetical protein [bacterium]MDW8086825.1 hypothetical protein [Candidatus Calescibacterium sp.]
MKKLNLSFLYIFLSSIFFLSCYSRDIGTRLDNIEANNIRNREVIEILRKDVENIRKILSDMDSRISSLENRLERIRENSVNNERIMNEISRISRELEVLQSRVREISELSRKLEKDSKQQKTFPLSDTDAANMLADARESLLKGDVDRAYDIVKMLVSSGYFSYELKFIAGEIFFRRQDYRAAIKEWLNIVQEEKNVKDVNILPRTYLRLSNAFMRIGDNKNAELMLQAIISKYPESPETKTARDLLQQLKNQKKM